MSTDGYRAFVVGDYVWVELQEPRTDQQLTYVKSYGTIVEAFNAWSPITGDRWQYKIRTAKGRLLVFYEGKDQGTIELVPPESSRKWSG